MNRAKSNNTKKIFMVFCVSLTVFSFIAGCVKQQEITNKKEVIPVKAMRVGLEDIKETLDYVGDIKAQEEAMVYSKVTGKIIEKVAQEGSPVKKGDIIAYIDRDEIGFKFEKAPVESPLEGVVGRVYVDIGANVLPSTPIALVVSTEKVEINLDVPEKYFPSVSLGQIAQVFVDAYPNEEFIGKVTKISPVLDLATRTAPVEITIDNSLHKLNSGMFAEVKLILHEYKNTPVVLKEAVLGKGSNPYVYTIENGLAQSKNIQLGIRQGELFEVKKGLKQGDVVVIMGQQRLHDGVAVRVEE